MLAISSSLLISSVFSWFAVVEVEMFPGNISLSLLFPTLGLTSLFRRTRDAGMLNVRSDLSNSLGDDEAGQIDLVIVESEDADPVDGGAEFLPNNGLNLLLDFGLGEPSLLNDFLFGLGVRLNILLKLALKLQYNQSIYNL